MKNKIFLVFAAICAMMIFAPAIKAAPTTNISSSYTWGATSAVDVNATITCTPENSTSTCSVYECADTVNTCIPENKNATTYPVTISSEGTTYIRYQSYDGLGGSDSVQSKTVIINKTQPVTLAIVTGVASYTNQTSYSVTFSSNVAGTLAVSGDCTSASTAATSGNNTITLALANNTQGAKTCNIQVTAGASNTTLPVIFTYDNLPPTATFSNLPTASTGMTSANITVGGDGVVTYRYYLDYGTESAETNVSTAISLSGLSVAGHSISVVGKDQAGNWQTSPTTYSWTVIQSSAPQATLSGTPSANTTATSISITVGGTDITKYKYKLDNESYSAEKYVATKITATALDEGTHIIYVLGMNGNNVWQTEATTYQWEITEADDTTATSSDSHAGKVRMYQFPETLEEGDTGSDVGKLQERLKYEGFYKGTITSKFDAATVAALKEYQAENKLTQTGRLDTKTLEYMNSHAPWISQEAANSDKVRMYQFADTLEEGDQGLAVGELQKRLKYEGFYKGGITAKYDGPTVSAMKGYQAENKLTQTGRLDTKTLEYMNARAPWVSKGLSTSQLVPLIKKEFKIAKWKGGATNDDDVKELQKRLTSLGIYKWAINGNFDVFTEYAVKMYQWKNKLLMTGKLDAATMALLNKTAGTTQTTSGSTATAFQFKIAKAKGAINDNDVKELQKRLASLGIYKWAINGNFDVYTQYAVLMYQWKNKLPMTGKLDIATMALLNKTAPKQVLGASATTQNTGGAREMQLGDEGEDVKELQIKLAGEGFYSGTKTGKFDQRTENALKNFQSEYKLSATGVVNAATRTKLKLTK